MLLKKSIYVKIYKMSKFINKVLFLPVLFVILSFISCSNDTNSIITLKKDNTIKNEILYKDNSINWTTQLDTILKIETTTEDKKNLFDPLESLPDEIKQHLTNKDKQNTEKTDEKAFPRGLTELPFSDRLFYNKNQPESKEILPYLDGFTSLDTSSLIPEIINVIQKFINQANEKKISIDDISPDTRFLQPIYQKQIDSLEEITDVIFGKPFIEQNNYLNEYQVPVRLISPNGYYDDVFYMVNIDDKYYIEQIFFGSLISE